MSFNVAIAVQAPVVTAQAGVESVVLGWTVPADFTPASLYEVWGGNTNSFDSAVKLFETTDPKFAEAGLQAEVERFYWVRAARTFLSSDVKYSTPAPASATPIRATLGTGQVNTVHVAPEAITVRSTYQESHDEYVRAGTDEQGDPIDPAEGEWTLGDIPFLGDGNVQVISCFGRHKEMPANFRVGGSVVTAMMSASILDTTDEPEVVADYAEMSVGAMRLDQFPVAPAQWISSTHHRDFSHNFIVPTVEGRTYAVRFKIWCFCDNPDNYVLYATDLRQVLWQVYKR